MKCVPEIDLDLAGSGLPEVRNTLAAPDMMITRSIRIVCLAPRMKKWGLFSEEAKCGGLWGGTGKRKKLLLVVLLPFVSRERMEWKRAWNGNPVVIYVGRSYILGMHAGSFAVADMVIWAMPI